MSLDEADSIVKHQKLMGDGFLGGRLTIAQPEKGFRAGLDSVLLGASVSVASGRLLDLGAGVGTAALVALSLFPGLGALLAENEAGALELARHNIIANDFSARAAVVAVDVTAPGAARQAAGLAPDSFAAVIANPPFFDRSAGTRAPAADRAAARQMDTGLLDLWVKTAASAATPGGEVIFVQPAENLSPLLAAIEARFGGVAVLPLAPRPEMPASRVFVRGIKGSRAPTTLLATRPVHAGTGHDFSPAIEDVLRGRGRFVW